MSTSEIEAPPRALVWTGRVISVLAGVFFLMSAGMKFSGSAELTEAFAHLGLPIDTLGTIAALEIASAVLFLLPQTAVVGTILLTGYMGGAILAHLRVGDPVTTNVILAVVVWIGIVLRDRRLWALLPLRKL